MVKQIAIIISLEIIFILTFIALNNHLLINNFGKHLKFSSRSFLNIQKQRFLFLDSWYHQNP